MFTGIQVHQKIEGGIRISFAIIKVLPIKCFSGVSDGKEFILNGGDLGSFPGLRRSPGRGHGNPLQYSSLENPHGHKSLVGYSPRGHKELDMTE